MPITFSSKLCLFLIFFLFLSCASRKDVVYLQDIENTKTTANALSYEPVLKNDDLLSIIVSADDPEITYMFNIPQIQGNYQVEETQSNIRTYLIDSYGQIEFPVLGKITLAGLTRKQAVNELTEKVRPYIKNPTINMRILNYKIAVLGEVTRPGTFTMKSERITVFEALANAGDLTIFGKRDNILIIRENNGTKSYNRVDITNSDFINSDFYYLTQNDVVIVEPNKTRINSSKIGPDVQALLGLAGLVVSSLSLIILLTR
ncbi:polysaccharide biosynthesis/export family protein [Flavobacterium sp. j3]|uniref:Polysaccharide biosynthesis/export family protein n=1 Tax=Flavobacterium aureirubrum TaxID=3133147 RepID=A0ABU9N3L6_9FLAO